MHLPPPLASSVLSSQWNPKPPKKDSIYPSGASVQEWQDRLNSSYQRYRFAATWNNYEDPRYRNSFDANGNSVEPVGTVTWLKNRYNGISRAINLNDVVDPKESIYSLYAFPSGAEQLVGSNYTTFSSFATTPIFKFFGNPYRPAYLKTIHKLDENGKLVEVLGDKRISIFRMSYNHLTSKQEYAAFSTPNRLDGEAIKITNTERGGSLPSLLNALSSNDSIGSSSAISIIFREYVHYIGNPLGGTGLLDLTPFTVNATTYVERNLKTDIYSPYSLSQMDLVVDYNNQLPIHLWPKTRLIGLE